MNVIEMLQKSKILRANVKLNNNCTNSSSQKADKLFNDKDSLLKQKNYPAKPTLLRVPTYITLYIIYPW